MNERGLALLVMMMAVWTTSVTAFQACVQKIPNCRGADLDCSRSVPCYHGNCSVAGSCSCQHCWTGQNCDRYVDSYLPKFLIRTDTLTISPHDTGILYTVNGLDEDAMNTCRQQVPCPCSEMRYSIARGSHDDLFRVDPKEGDVYLKTGELLQPGADYTLVIVVGRVHGDVYAEPDGSGQNEFQLNLIVSDPGPSETDNHHEVAALQKSEVEEPYIDEEEDHIRNKRAATGNSNDTTIVMSYTDTYTSQLNIGDRVDLNLTILVPPGVTMDMTVEIFTSDPENLTAAYALCGVSVQTLRPGVTSTLGTVTPIISPNSFLPVINDHALISFGNVTGSATASDADRTILITFSAVLVGNSPYVQDGNNYSIVAGTSYAGDTYIWVAAATFTANVAPDDQYYGSTQTIDGPPTIGTDGYGVYEVDFYSTTPWTTLKIDVFGNQEVTDSYSTGAIIITSMGSNYMCMVGSATPIAAYSYVGTASTTGLTTAQSSLIASGVLNCVLPGQDRTAVNITANKIIIRFLIYVPPSVKPVGSILSMGATITIGDKTIWTNVLNLTIGSEDDTDSGAPTSMIPRNTSLTTAVQGVASILVDIVIPENKFSRLIIQVVVPTSGGTTALMTVCSTTATWGVNVPIVRAAQSNLTSSTGGSIMDTMTSDFGRVWNSALLQGNQTAGTVTIAIGVRVEDPAANGKTVKVTVIDNTGATIVGPVSVTINVDTSPQNATNITGTVNVYVTDRLNTSSLVVEGETMIEMTATFANGTSFGALTFEAMSSLLNETMEGRVCRASVYYVGSNIPCINAQTINTQVSYSLGNLPNPDPITGLASMNLGSVCLTDPTDTNINDGTIILTAAVELPRQLPGIAGTTYTMYGGIKLGTSMIWAGSTTYNVIGTQTDIFPPNCQPTINASQSLATPAIPGMAVVVLIQIKIPPTSQSVYVLTVTATAVDPFAICQLNIQYLGYNFPCVDPNPIPGNVSRVATTRLNYDSYDANLLASRKAILDFGAMSNLGKDPFTSDTTPDKNTIVVAATLKIDPAAAKSLNLGYSLKYGSTPTTIGSSLVIPLSASAPPPAATSINATINTLDGSSTIGLNVTKIIALDFQMPSGPASITKVIFSNPNSANNDFVFCSAAVTKVGQNIPCLNASSVSPVIDNSAGGNCSNSLTMNLGTTCLTTIVNDQSQNWIRVEVAVNILNLKLTGSITVQAIVSAGSVSTQTTPLVLSVDGSPTQTTPIANLTVSSLTNGSVSAPVGSKIWVDYNLTIPINMTIPLQLTALGASSSGRAIVTVTGVRVTAAGTNVACIKNTTIVNVLLNSSAAVTTMQNDEAIVDFGYISNTGLTYRRGFNQPYDDQITISVQVLMTDHPLADNNAQFALTVLFASEGEVFNASQMVAVTRNGTESPDIIAKAQLLNSKLFQRYDVAKVNFLLSHSSISTAEPTQTIIRLYLPNYTVYLPSSLSCNVTATEQLGSTQTSILITDPFYFDEFIEVNFSLTIDPNGLRNTDTAMINATSVGQIFAKMTQRMIGGTQYPSTNNLMYAGNGFYWIYGISGGNCHNPLGMQTGAIQDCQLSASATVSSQFGPSQARLGNANGKLWKPAVRNGIYQNYIQVNFGNRTRVSQISFQQDPCCRAPTSIQLQYSDQGIYWSDGFVDPALNYSGDTAITDLAIPFEGRMLRIIINGSDQPEAAATKYIGVKLEFYGCPIATDVSQSEMCNSTSSTIYSTDVNNYRHFSVDSIHSSVYACDIQPNLSVLRCFCSVDGTVWKNIPTYITNMIGFDPTTGTTYGRDSSNSTYFKSNDCFSWLPANVSEVQTSQAGSQFTSSVVVPGLAQNDPGMTLTSGPWEATFDGLYLNSNKRLGWS